MGWLFGGLLAVGFSAGFFIRRLHRLAQIFLGWLFGGLLALGLSAGFFYPQITQISADFFMGWL
jgi:hypothetical protein